jgi:transposase
MQIHSVGIDLGKTTFHLVALGEAGKVLIKKKFTQRQLLTYTANLQTSLIGLEACSGAHFLGRAWRIHEVVLVRLYEWLHKLRRDQSHIVALIFRAAHINIL